MRDDASSTKQIELLLRREAAMASMSLGLGLTHIRKYDFVQPGYFYSSLYSIATGLERLMKLVVIYNHRLTHDGQFPDNSQLRDYGHDLAELFNKAIAINEASDFQNDASLFERDPLYRTIIGLLSDFAKTARYYNLDTVTGRQQATDEPLRRWANEVSSVIEDRHYKPVRGRTQQIEQAVAALEDDVFVMLSDESGGNINSLNQFYLDGDKVPVRQKYSVYYIYVIARFLCNLLSCLETKGRFFPFLREFFVVFQNEDTAYILNKKTWNPNPPYKF